MTWLKTFLVGHVSFVDTAEIEEPDKNTGRPSMYHVLHLYLLVLRKLHKTTDLITTVCLYFHYICTFICIPGYVLGHYEVYFSLEIICEPAAPVKVIDVECVAQVSSFRITLLFWMQWTTLFIKTAVGRATAHISQNATNRTQMFWQMLHVLGKQWRTKRFFHC